MNLEDSRHTRSLSEASLRDGAGTPVAQLQDVMLVFTGKDWSAHSHEADIIYDDDLLPCVVRFGEYTLDVGLGKVIYPLQSAFGMHLAILEDDTFGTVPHYLAVTIPLTLFTVWVMVALHRHRDRDQDPESDSLWQTLKWPLQALRRSFHDLKRKNKDVSAVV